MKKKIFMFIVFIYVVGYNVFGQEANIDIKAYNIKANCDLNKRIIDITANLNIEKPVNSNFFKILLCSWTNISSIKSGQTTIQFSRNPTDSDTLLILLPEQFKNDKKINLSFNYTLLLDSFDLKNKNLIYLQRGSYWYPLQYNEIASMKLDIVAPNNYTIFAIGDLIYKKNIGNNIEYNFETKQNNRYTLIAIKSDTFNSTLAKNINNVNMNFFFVSKDTDLNNKIVKEVCNSFSFYVKLIGDYKYKQFNIIEIPDSRFMFAESLSTMLIMGTPFIKAYRLDFGDWPAHEVAHQWWGNGVFTDFKAKGGLFLEESVDEYFKALYIENTWGVDSLKGQFKAYLNLYKNVEKDKELPIIEITNTSTMEKGYVIYQKGPLVVNKLRNLMGYESYKKFINELYNLYYGKLLTLDEFFMILAKYDSNGNIVNSLNKWLSETGYIE